MIQKKKEFGGKQLKKEVYTPHIIAAQNEGSNVSKSMENTTTAKNTSPKMKRALKNAEKTS